MRLSHFFSERTAHYGLQKWSCVPFRFVATTLGSVPPELLDVLTITMQTVKRSDDEC
jgi:hypothetical protein